MHLIYVVLALLEPTELVGVQGQHSTLHIYADRSLVAQDPRIMVIKNVLIWTDWWKSGDAGSRLRVSPLHGAATPRTVWVGHVATGIVLQYISMLSMWAHLYDSMTTSLTRFVVRRMTHASEGAASIKPLRVQRVATPPSEKHPQSATITPICPRPRPRPRPPWPRPRSVARSLRRPAAPRRPR